MGQVRRMGASGGRVGLVLGAGGVVGAAWMTGALQAVQDRLPMAINDVDLIVGTSAGSVLAAALRCGVSLDEMIALQRGDEVRWLREAGVGDLDEGPLPPRPQWRAGSPRLILHTLRAPHRVHPGVGASAWLPRGRARHETLHAMVQALQQHAPRPVARLGGRPRPGSSPVDYDSGRRVIFGRDRAPEAELADAVVASCSIPGWYVPRDIGGRRYVDGGVRSPTSLAVLARAGRGRGVRAGPDGQPGHRPARHPAGAAGAAAARGWSPGRCCARRRRCGPRASGSPCSPPGRRTWPRWG